MRESERERERERRRRRKRNEFKTLKERSQTKGNLRDGVRYR